MQLELEMQSREFKFKAEQAELDRQFKLQMEQLRLSSQQPVIIPTESF